MTELVCFIHSCTLGVWGSTKLEGLVSKLRNSGLLARLSHLFINNVGQPLDANLFPEEHVLITNYSEDTSYFENCTLRHMYFYAQQHPDTKLLYLHTKGVSYGKDHPYTPNVQDWADFMTYGLIENHEFCIEMLDHVDTVGLDYRSQKMASPQYPDPNHFSGNYWWVNAKYWITVPISTLKTKYDAEWILFKMHPTFINIWKCPVGHYENPYKLSEYQDHVQDRIAAYRYLFKNIKQMRVYYGTDNYYIDVTSSSKTDNSISIPAGDHSRVLLYGVDPYLGKFKNIRIGEVDEVHLTVYLEEDFRIKW